MGFPPVCLNMYIKILVVNEGVDIGIPPSCLHMYMIILVVTVASWLRGIDPSDNEKFNRYYFWTAGKEMGMYTWNAYGKYTVTITNWLVLKPHLVVTLCWSFSRETVIHCYESRSTHQHFSISLGRLGHSLQISCHNLRWSRFGGVQPLSSPLLNFPNTSTSGVTRSGFSSELRPGPGTNGKSRCVFFGQNLSYMGVSLNGGSPKTPQNDDFK